MYLPLLWHAGDGNCFYRAISLSQETKASSGDKVSKTSLIRQGINHDVFHNFENANNNRFESYSLIKIANTYMGNHTNDQSGKFLKGNSTNNIVSFDKQFNIFERLRKINALIPFILLLLITAVEYVLRRIRCKR